jgi:WD40 repeat protein
VTGGTDSVVRLYDEATRKLEMELSGTSSGGPGHSSRVFACKFDKEDENLVITGGWDKTI